MPLSINTGSTKQDSHSIGLLGQAASTFEQWRNELRVYHSADGRDADSDLLLPRAEVRVISLLENGSAVPAVLEMGPGSLGSARERRSLFEVTNDAVRESSSHRTKLGILFQRETLWGSTRQNAEGTFTFGSLSDFERGAPTSFTRSLGGTTGEAQRINMSLYAGDTWEATARAALIYGLRVESSSYRPLPAVSSAAGPWAGPRTIPSDFFLLPRIGFSYRLDRRGPILRGGVGAYRGALPIRLITAAATQTGTDQADAQLVCIGSSVPLPEWRTYLADPTQIPTTCQGASSSGASHLASISLFGRELRAPRTWKMTLGVDGNVVDKISYQVNGSVVRGTHLLSAVDLNLDPTVRFSLPAEAGRPVFVGPAAIDSASGMTTLGSSRIVPGVGLVRELEAAGESYSAQLSAGLTGIVWKRLLFGLTYTYGFSRDRAGGIPAAGAPIASTANDPLRLTWSSSDYDRRHSITLLASERILPNVQVGLLAQLGSGFAYTPMVASDINGDGLANDRAFVFGASASDSAVGRDMEHLLSEAPGAARACLLRQLGAIAGRNSCRTAWSTTVNAEAKISPRGYVDSRRLLFTVTLSNLTAGLDYLLHGSDALRGWGQFPVTDGTLLEVRGFDPARRAYRYTVNPNFGRPLSDRLFRVPMQLTLQARVAVGADPRTQPLERFVGLMNQARSGPAQIRRSVADRVRNVPATVIALYENDPGELELSVSQLRSLRAAADSLSPFVDAAVEGLTASLTEPIGSNAVRQARALDAARSAQAVLDKGMHVVRAILLPRQLEKLPSWLTSAAELDELMRPPSVQLSLPGQGP